MKNSKTVLPDTAESISVHEQAHRIKEEYAVREDKIAQLRALGIDPWPAAKPVTASCASVIQQFSDTLAGNDEDNTSKETLAGRVMTIREHGKTMFMHIQDGTGKLQVYLKQDVIGEALFAWIKKFIDLGDILWVEGTPFRTKTGEVTLKVTAVTLQSKCLHPLPEKFHGLVDVETKYRQRYLDLISSAESKERFYKRSRIIHLIRQFMDEHGFIEVETPMLHPIPGGAIAKPFSTHHNALDMELFLRIAPELYLKKLVIGGFDRVYEINRCFRNEGLSTRHNPEFTTIELYAAHLDYGYMMGFVETMLRHVAIEVTGSAVVPFGSHMLDFSKPFARMTMCESIMHYAPCSAKEIEADGIDQLLAKHHITLANVHATWGEKINALFEHLVEGKLIQPTFITEFPIEVSPLAKRNMHNPAIVDRFELFMAGMELSNAFNELNDPFDQAQRFREQANARAGGDQEAHYYDADYITALEHGLPPTVGVGIGIDRLTMFLTNAASIKDVILFPTLKKRVS